METTQPTSSVPESVASAAQASSQLSFFGRIKQLLTNPEQFFESAKHESGYHQAFQMFAALIPISIVFGLAIQRMFLSSTMISSLYMMMGRPAPAVATVSLVWLLPLALFAYVCALLGVFIGTAFLHIWVMIWGGKGSFAETFRLNVYSSVPKFLFGWIPVVGIFVWVYDMILAIIGVQKLHQVSRTKAILMFVIPVILEVLLVITLVIGSIAFLASVKDYMTSRGRASLNGAYGTSTLEQSWEVTTSTDSGIDSWDASFN